MRSVKRLHLRGQQGFTLIEMLVAMFVLAIGIIATMNVFTSSKAISVVAQRYEVGVHQAQREMERLRSLPYSELGLTSQPAVADRLSADPNKVGYFNGATFTVKSSAGAQAAVSETLVLPATNATGAVNPAPTPFTLAGGGVSGKVYRYITWRPEDCGNDGAGQPLCPGNQDTKRILVAVKMDANGNVAPSNPVWVTSVAIDPTSKPYE
jgi:prepilin-type N-terminal cleavage/methylation domain-containing protein